MEPKPHDHPHFDNPTAAGVAQVVPVMSRRYDAIELPYTEDFGGRGVVRIPLTIDDQDSPLLLALLRWKHDQLLAASSAAKPPDANDLPIA